MADERFRVWRQTRTGLMSYPVRLEAARGHLGASIYLQMAMRPHIVHVVGYCEADHAARPEEVIESCHMAQRAIENALRGAPDMTTDPKIQQRKAALKTEAMEIVALVHISIIYLMKLRVFLKSPFLLNSKQVCSRPFADHVYDI